MVKAQWCRRVSDGVGLLLVHAVRPLLPVCGCNLAMGAMVGGRSLTRTVFWSMS